MSIVKFLLPLVLVLATCCAHDPIFEEVQPSIFDYVPTDYGLPNSGVKPLNYEITLQPYFESAPKDKDNFSFDGSVKITLERDDTIKETKEIILHADKLANFKAVLQYTNIPAEGTPDPEPTKQEAVDFQEDSTDKNFLTIFFKDNIPTLDEAKDFSLTITYNGTLMHEDFRGFYRSSYTDEDDDQAWLATTQFEPTYARRAFPCWDEPQMKATFDITIIHPSDYDTVISNMQEKQKPKDKKDKKEMKAKKDDDDVITQFERTPTMSTYLVAFIVSKFESAANDDENFSVWTKPDDVDRATYALESGQSILSEMEDYTGITYFKKKNDKISMDMKKMDQVSIPDFYFGAMENWGLVTYRDPLLLYKENVTSAQNMQNILTLIAHEFSHQWFGNLVTPKWWNDIWLNEGFATFFQYFISDMVERNWRLMEQFVVKNMQESAFVTDATIYTREMSRNAATPDQILSLFDNIAYKKAACVIRMMQHFLTEDVFKDALKQYLSNEENMYNSVTPEKLFEAMDKAAASKKKKVDLPEEVKDLMKNWVNRQGYPIIKVGIDNSTGDMTVSQERFYLSKPLVKDDTKWYIPINFITESEPEDKETKVKIWLPSQTKPKKFTKQIKDTSKWVIVNNLQTGYYRVNYDVSNWNRLTAYLDTDDFEKIDPVNRAMLIDDALNIARGGYMSYTNALPITRYLYREVDYIPWYAAARGFDFLSRNLQDMTNYDHFRDYVAQKMGKYVENVELKDTPKNNTHMYQLGRELMLVESCKYGHEGCMTYTQQKFKAWLKDKKELPEDLRDGILCGGVRQADQETWNTTLSMYKNSSDPIEKKAILNALGCVQDKDVIRTFLQLSLEQKPVIDLFDTLDTISRNNYRSFDILIDFINENIDAIKDLDKDKSKLTNHANQLATTITNERQYGQLALLAVREYVLFDGFVGMVTGEEKLNWIENNQEEISEWIKENYVPAKQGNSATSITSMVFLTMISVLIARFY